MRKKQIIKKQIISLALAVAVTVSGITVTDVTTKAASTTNINKAATTSKTPENLEFKINSATSCTITWKAIDGATYKIYKAKSRYADYGKTAVATVETNTYTDDNYDGSYYKVTSVVDGKESEKSKAISYEIQTFGYDTHIFETSDEISQVQSVIDDIYKTTEAGQFISGRQALMFAPGQYNKKDKDLTVKIGFYTQVAGLGISPEDTEVDYIRCQAEWMKGIKYDGSVNYSALCNFWRSVENLTSDATSTLWAVSQATSMRRMNLTGSMATVRERDKNGKWVTVKKNVGNLYLHQEGGYASGGFLADSKIYGEISSGSQQQWLTRNTVAGSMQGAVWNNVVVGSATKTADGKLVQLSGTENTWPKGTNTVVEKTPIVQEKPFLVIDTEGKYGEKGAYGVFVPELRKNAVGVSWDSEEIAGKFIGLDKFFVAKPNNTVDEINEALESGKNLIFTPGIYKVDKAINVKNNDTVILGLGYATLQPTKGNQAMIIGDVDNVILAGVLFDAGNVKSKSLLTVGSKKNSTTHEKYSVALCDTFYRVGGADSKPQSTEACVIINSNDVIGDNFWIWRADHGAGVAWNKNVAEYGVIINGDDVTTYGLMVEHFQKYQTQWNGENGRCYMYQSELPYDITSQKVWNEPGSYGYTDYKVGSNVKKHEGYGMGIYSCYQAATCFLKSAITCPDTPGVKFTNVCTYSLSGNGGIDYVINKSGYMVLSSGEMSRVMSYCNGKYTQDKTAEKAKIGIWRTGIDIKGKEERYLQEFKVAYTGKAITPKVTVTYKNIKLREGIDYKVVYKNNKKIGNAKITIVGINGFNDKDTYTMKIVPKKVTVKSVKLSKKKVNIKIDKVKGAKGYEYAVYKTNGNAKKNKKALLKKTSSKRTVKLSSSKFAKQKKVYVKVRAYGKNTKGKLVYGSWSKVKKSN